MNYTKAIKYLLQILTIESEELLRKYAVDVLKDNNIEVTAKAVDCSIVSLAEYYK